LDGAFFITHSIGLYLPVTHLILDGEVIVPTESGHSDFGCARDQATARRDCGWRAGSAKSHGLTIVTAESCTAGAIATALSTAPGAADYFLGGFVTYTKKMKNKILRVPLKLLKNKGAVCREVAEAMAAGALKLADADIAVSVTGVAGPEPDEDGNPVGLVFCGAAMRKRKPIVVRHFFEGLSRDAINQAATEETLTLLQHVCRQ
jgi:PncC family amidohydrolase